MSVRTVKLSARRTVNALMFRALTTVSVNVDSGDIATPVKVSNNSLSLSLLMERSRVTSALVFFFDLCSPALENANVIGDHHDLLP